MNIEQLEAFIYIALTGSFSKAGEILYLSQPTISSKIKVLEKEIDATLFGRTGNNVYITEEGKAFLPYAQEVIQNIHKGKLSIQKMNNILDGEISISVVFSGTSYLFPKLVKEFNKKYPKIKLVVYSGHSDQVLTMVLTNEVSLGIVRSIAHPQIECVRLEEDEMILVFHPSHPFNTSQKIEIKDLAKEPLILFKRDTLDWMLINNAFKKANLFPNIVMEIDSVEGAKQMVLHDIGAAFLPNFSVSEELQVGDLRTVPVVGIPQIQRNFELIFRKGDAFGGVLKLFLDFVVQNYSLKSV